MTDNTIRLITKLTKLD